MKHVGTRANPKDIASQEQLAGFRNKIINGKMDIAQRGTGFSGVVVGSASYAVDRFQLTGAGTTAAFSYYQSTSVPALNQFKNSLVAEVTTADAAMAATETAAIQQVIEGFNVRDLLNRTFTLSFWARSSKTGVHCVSFFNSGLDRSYIKTYTINAANTWEFKQVTVTDGIPSSGAWNFASGAGVYVRWVMSAGSNFHTSADAWQAGLLMSTAGQVNCLDTIGNIFAITGVQLEVGPVATPFEHRPYGLELALCRRYFERFDNSNYGFAMGGCYATGAVWATVALEEKRVPPILTCSGPVGNFQMQLAGGTGSCTSYPYISTAGNRRAFVVFPSTSAGLTNNGQAALLLLSGAATMDFSSEL